MLSSDSIYGKSVGYVYALLDGLQKYVQGSPSVVS